MSGDFAKPVGSTHIGFGSSSAVGDLNEKQGLKEALFPFSGAIGRNVVELFGTIEVPARANSDICFDSVAADWHHFLKIEFASKLVKVPKS